MEKQKSIPQENTTSPLTAVENLMFRGDSLTISGLARDSVSPPQPKPKSSRFLDSTSFDVANFIAANENKNTKQKTNQDLNLIHSYLASKGEFRQIHEIPPTELCELISAFLFAVR